MEVRPPLGCGGSVWRSQRVCVWRTCIVSVLQLSDWLVDWLGTNNQPNSTTYPVSQPTNQQQRPVKLPCASSDFVIVILEKAEEKKF